MGFVSPARSRMTDKKPDAAPLTLPGPSGGWVENVDMGKPNAARVMENAFPTVQGARVRGGKTKVATVGARARSMFTYKTGSVENLFASTGTALYDVTAINPSTVPTASITGLTSGAFVAAQIATPGGEYLIAVNGADTGRIYDGSSWANTSFTGVTSSLLSYVWVHKNRYWFIEKNSRRAWYLPVDSISGVAVSITMDGVFQRGGSLMFGATWSQDAGSGMDDRAVFVSTEGEVAVFQGSDPSNAALWAMVGLYNIPKPMGAKCHMRAGGDLLIGTSSGLIPLSAIVSKDPAALDVTAVSAAIDLSWRREAALSDGVQPWEIAKWPAENLMLVTLPHSQTRCIVANLQTGAWAKYLGWDVQCTAIFGGKLYFGEKTGSIFAAESGGSDDGASYTVRVSYMPNNLGAPTAFKSVGAIRGTFFCAEPLVVQMSMSSDYASNFPALPRVYSPGTLGAAIWDVSTWDQARWDDDGLANALTRPVVTTGWVSVGANGYTVSPQMQIVVSGGGRPTAELIAVDLAGDSGGAVV